MSPGTLAAMEKDLVEKQQALEPVLRRLAQATPGTRHHTFLSQRADHLRSEAMQAERFVRRARGALP